MARQQYQAVLISDWEPAANRSIFYDNVSYWLVRVPCFVSSGGILYRLKLLQKK